ncbi:MAG: hypothetical protein KIT11_02960 [Fimbriimonadaceae bacterium]|nr:hypothetical protein [Fimbriimonadaceae bacterium]QYK54672.1 MAG: hypothetical protein KF733_06565 [Fimbriimonadaceae bacterium]
MDIQSLFYGIGGSAVIWLLIDLFYYRRKPKDEMEAAWERRFEAAQREIDELRAKAAGAPPEADENVRLELLQAQRRIAEMEPIALERDKLAEQLRELRASSGDSGTWQERHRRALDEADKLRARLRELEELEDKYATVVAERATQASIDPELAAENAELKATLEKLKAMVSERAHAALDPAELRALRDRAATVPNLEAQLLQARRELELERKKAAPTPAPDLAELAGLKARAEMLPRLESELAAAKQQVEKLTRQVEKAPALQVAELEALRERASRSSLLEARLQDANNELARISMERGGKDVQSELEELRAQLAASQAELTQQRGRASTPSGASEEYRERYERLAEQAAGQAATIEALMRELGNDAPAETTELRAKLDQAERRASALEDELAAMREQAAGIGQARQLLVEAANKLKAMSGELTSARQRASDAETALLRVESQTADLAKLREQAEAAQRATEESEALRKGFEAAKQAAAASAKEVERLNSQLEEQAKWRAEAEQASTRLAELEGQSAESRRAAEAVANEAKELREALTKAKAAAATAQEEAHRQSGRVAELQAAVADLQAKKASERTAESTKVSQALQEEIEETRRILESLDGGTSEPEPPRPSGNKPEPVLVQGQGRVPGVSLASRRDPLDEITGLGPVYKKMLWDAGILTFGDLAAAGPKVLRETLHLKEWQGVDCDEWIRQAAAMAREEAS